MPVTGRPTPDREAEVLVLDDLVPVRRSEAEVYRGNQRRPLISIYTPAQGILNAKASQRLQQVAAIRALGTVRPNRLETRFSETANLLVAIPALVNELDEVDEDEDLFEIRWYGDGSRANINLIEFLQPRNMVVPQGQVMEVPVSIRTVQDVGVCLVLDFSAPAYRGINAEDAAHQVAVTREAGA